MRRFYIGLCIVLLFLLSLFADASMGGAAKGLELFVQGVFPALFPFCVCIGCLKRFVFFSTRTNGGFFALLRLMLLGAVAGNPTGSMLVSGFCREEGKIDLVSLSVYAALFNLASPAFIIGAVSSRMLGFDGIRHALLIMIAHYSSAFFIFSVYYILSTRSLKKDSGEGPCYRAGKRAFDPKREGTSLVSVLPSAIMDAISTMLKLCGTIVFFVTIAELMNRSAPFAHLPRPIRSVFVGALEMTSGLDLLSGTAIDLRTILSLTCFMISFGGISIFMQSKAVAQINSAAYLSAKLMHGVCAFSLCYLLFPLFFAGDIGVIGSEADRLVKRALTVSEIAFLCLISSASASLAAVCAAKRTRA